jgi:probable phosphoglycerate mutase
VTTLYLIRHGHYGDLKARLHIVSDVNPTEPLNDVGRAQIEQLAKRLKGSTIKIAITSEFARARESGQIIADALDIPIETSPALNEIGFFVKPQEIMTFERDEKRYRQAIKDVEEASQKAVEFLQQIAKDHQGETVAVVCHGNIIRAIVGQALKVGVDSTVRLQVDLASLSVLEYDGADLFRLILFNDTCHLED